MHTEAVLRNVTVKKNNAASAYVVMHNDGEASSAATLTFDTLTAMKTLGKDDYKTGELVTTCPADQSKLEIWDERA